MSITGILKDMARPVKLASNGLGNSRQCYVCKRTFRRFTKHRGGKAKQTQYKKLLQMVGSDLDNYRCMYCRSNDRERHLCMYFDKLNLWEHISGGNVLHIAPEIHFGDKVKDAQPKELVRGDITPDPSRDVIAVDVTRIQFEDDHFDMIICNHVLEHVPAIEVAMNELFRVAKPGAVLILQTPVSRFLSSNFYDASITSEAHRKFFYGQEDHVRIFSEARFYEALENTGFELDVRKNSDCFSDAESRRYGINAKENLMMVRKPGS